MIDSRLTPNLNGESGVSLYAKRDRILQALRELRDAMHDAWPHGRDYQLSDEVEAYYADRHVWSGMTHNAERFQRRIEADMKKLKEYNDAMKGGR